MMKKKNKKIKKNSKVYNLTPQYPYEDVQEDKSKELFLLKLRAGKGKKYIDTSLGKKYPGLDGTIRIFNEDSTMSGYTFDYQLRNAPNPKKAYLDCEQKFLVGVKLIGESLAGEKSQLSIRYLSQNFSSRERKQNRQRNNLNFFYTNTQPLTG